MLGFRCIGDQLYLRKKFPGIENKSFEFSEDFKSTSTCLEERTPRADSNAFHCSRSTLLFAPPIDLFLRTSAREISRIKGVNEGLKVGKPPTKICHRRPMIYGTWPPEADDWPSKCCNLLKEQSSTRRVHFESAGARRSNSHSRCANAQIHWAITHGLKFRRV